MFNIRKSQQPSAGTAHVSRPLTNISIAFQQDAVGFIADQVFPVIPVAKSTDKYYKFDRDSWNRDEFALRAGGTESAKAGFTLSTDSYTADVYALHVMLDEQLEGDEDEGLDLRRAATQFLTQKSLIQRERAWASTYFATGVWGTDAVPGIKWDVATGIPITNLRAGMQVVQSASGGFRPNTLVLSRLTWDILQDSADILARLNRGQTSGPAKANLSDLAALLELDRVLVSDGVFNSAVEGATESSGFAMPLDGALLLYVAPAPGKFIPSAGYTFQWSGLSGSQGSMVRMKQIDKPDLEAVKIEAQMAYDHKVVASEFGYLFHQIDT